MAPFGLFGGKKKSAAAIEIPECPHAILVPRWGSVQDMGIEAKATSFMCDGCHKEFTPAEAAEIRTGIAERLVGQDAAEESNVVDKSAE